MDDYDLRQKQPLKDWSLMIQKNKNRLRVLALITVLLLFWMGCSTVPRNSSPELQVVSFVDLERYLGKWYEIARYPHSFEKGCYAATAFYEKIDAESIKVTNKCRKNSFDGKLIDAVGRATVADKLTKAKLQVQFFWPFKGNYWIIELDEDYQYAVVSEPNRQYLWILSRSPKMSSKTLEELKANLRKQGFDLSYLILTPQL